MPEQEQLLKKIEESREVLKKLEFQLRDFKYKITESPLEDALIELGLYLSQEYAVCKHNFAYATEQGLSIQKIQDEARYELMRDVITCIPGKYRTNEALKDFPIEEND